MSGTRWVLSSKLPQAVLDEYFKGPGATERYSYGWVALYNGFTGYERLEVRDGGAHVFLKGGCFNEGYDFTIAELIALNLRQFPYIRYVKVYDAQGQTQFPEGERDSRPACLEPWFTPSPTP